MQPQTSLTTEPKARFCLHQKAFMKEGMYFEAVVIKQMRYVSSTSSYSYNNKQSSSDELNNHAVKSSWTYYIHFIGWNSRWDKWVLESDLQEDTPENREKAKENKKEISLYKQKLKNDNNLKGRTKSEQKEKAARTIKKKGNHDEKSLRKISHDESGEIRSLRSNLPFTLKVILLNDEIRIMGMGRQTCQDHLSKFQIIESDRLLSELPCRLPIRKVLNAYLNNKSKTSLSSSSNINSHLEEQYQARPLEVSQGQKHEQQGEKCSDNKSRNISLSRFITYICTLFDIALPNILLYHPERLQYLNMFSTTANKSQCDEKKDIAVTSFSTLSNLRPCDVYGCQYLLRLFTRLPFLLNNLKILPQCSEMCLLGIQEKINDLTCYLQQNKSKCFRMKYIEPFENELHQNEHQNEKVVTRANDLDCAKQEKDKRKIKRSVTEEGIERKKIKTQV